jgi:hypothetical protein
MKLMKQSKEIRPESVPPFGFSLENKTSRRNTNTGHMEFCLKNKNVSRCSSGVSTHVALHSGHVSLREVHSRKQVWQNVWSHRVRTWFNLSMSSWQMGQGSGIVFCYRESFIVIRVLCDARVLSFMYIWTQRQDCDLILSVYYIKDNT